MLRKLFATGHEEKPGWRYAVARPGQRRRQPLGFDEQATESQRLWRRDGGALMAIRVFLDGEQPMRLPQDVDLEGDHDNPRELTRGGPGLACEHMTRQS